MFGEGSFTSRKSSMKFIFETFFFPTSSMCKIRAKSSQIFTYSVQDSHSPFTLTKNNSVHLGQPSLSHYEKLNKRNKKLNDAIFTVKEMLRNATQERNSSNPIFSFTCNEFLDIILHRSIFFPGYLTSVFFMWSVILFFPFHGILGTNILYILIKLINWKHKIKEKLQFEIIMGSTYGYLYNR